MGMMMAHHRIRKAMEEKKKAQEAEEAAIDENAGGGTGGSQSDFDVMTVKDLKNYAQDNGIDISGLSKKDEIKARILEALKKNNDGIETAKEPEGGESPAPEDKGAGENGINGGTA